MKHTPGPWHMTEIAAGTWVTSQEGDICQVYHAPEKERTRADARLMAAAPELLAACQVARDFVALVRAHAPVPYVDEMAILSVLDNAIRGATGDD